MGLGLLLFGLASKIVSASTTPQADTRSWDNLPQYISFACASLPVGMHPLTVEFEAAGGKVQSNLTKTLIVNIAATDRDKVIFVSDTSTTPQTQ